MDAIDELDGAHGTQRPLEVLSPPLALTGELNQMLASTADTHGVLLWAWFLAVHKYFLSWCRRV